MSERARRNRLEASTCMQGISHEHGQGRCMQSVMRTSHASVTVQDGTAHTAALLGPHGRATWHGAQAALGTCGVGAQLSGTRPDACTPH
jgi:hypothetical protein